MAMHVSSVFAFDPAQRTFLSQPGAGGLSSQASVLEGLYAHAWSRNIWADALAAVD
jgi:sulfide dehydrogenase [flavocytochrome c] flavoprotein subunit